ncbi:MAG: acyl-homoserine-lactone acylase, partial [Candidatus Hydrogenedentes bacterium]|nr:acyl-homoserine-lactone acylase [Candidatus Hydrogenedentota bacterium]
PRDAAFGMGYAQAQDRLDDIYKNIRTAPGTMAEVFGEEHVEMDYIVRLMRNAELCQKYWDEAPQEIRDLGDGYMDGVKAFIAEHPEKVPEFACDLYGWQCGAVGRLMILQWPLGTIQDELNRKGEEPPFGSNGWAVAPSRSADGCAIHLTDPHLTWEGMQVFYEARVHCEAFEACAYFIVGSPLPGLGHSRDIAWACTTGGPDTADVYAMKLDPNIPMVYEYDGQMKAAEMKPIVIPVKDKDPVQMPALYTINGPAVSEPENGVLYAGNTPYLDDPGVFQQMYEMVKAKNCDEFYKALSMNHFMEQNVMFADREGNIQYVRTGRVPIRPEGFDWSKPVPGNTSATQWKGIHPIEDLVQIKNPPQGYFQNCNISPALMMKDSPMTPDKYIGYIYNVSWDHHNPRGTRALELLSGDDSITKDEAKDYAMNVYDICAKPWQKALKDAVDAAGAKQMKDPKFAETVAKIIAWDGRFVRESAAPPIVKFWRTKCENAFDVTPVLEMQAVSKDDQKKILDSLAETLADIEKTYGTLDITWGDVNWIGRGGQYFPCGGADFGGGKDKCDETETLLDISTEELPDQPGRYVGRVGSESIMLSFLHKEGIESYSCVMWGQSGDPQSPHYVDQARELYSQQKLKPTWFKKEELLQHVESEITLKTQ